MNKAFYADLIIERFDLENLENLSDPELITLWREVSCGIGFLKLQKFEVARLSGMKPNNLQNFKKLCHLAKHVPRMGKAQRQQQEKCDFCPQEFRSKQLLLSHQKLCHFVYRCPLCDEAIRGIINGQTHVTNVHEKLVPETRLGFHFC